MDIISMQKRQKEVDKLNMRNVAISRNALFYNLKAALLAKMGQLAEELGWFKHWKMVQVVNVVNAEKEFADCISFVLAIANVSQVILGQEELDNSISYFNALKGAYQKVSKQAPSHIIDLFKEVQDVNGSGQVRSLLYHFVGFGIISLDLSPQEIEKAYFGRIKTNIEQQK